MGYGRTTYPGSLIRSKLTTGAAAANGTPFRAAHPNKGIQAQRLGWVWLSLGMDDLLARFIVSITTVLIVAVVTQVAWPLVKGWLRRNPDVSGNWDVQESSGVSRGILTIRQSGSRISANFTHVDGGREFRYRGVMSGTKVALIFEEGRSKGNNIGTMVLNLNSDRKALSCVTAFWHNDAAEFRHNAYSAKRLAG